MGYLMKKKRINCAVSELVGAIILLAIVTTVMSLVLLQIDSDKGPQKKTYVRLMGKVEGTNLILEHQGGDSLGLDTNIAFTLAGKNYKFTVADLLIDQNHNNLWDLGERIIFPFKYDLYNLSKYQIIDIQAIDKESNSIQLLGSVDLHPASDLGVASVVSNLNPHKNDFINVSISVTSYGGDVNGSANITIKFLIPQGLRYINSTSEIGMYDNKTGLWYIPHLIGNKPITLQIRMQVISDGFREFTQFAMIMDGSGSIVASDWQLMRKGFSQALINDSVFPHDKSVELTVIQFGGSSPPHAQVEIPPTIVNNQLSTPGYYQTISTKITNLAQLQGYTPMGCGIRLAADQLHNQGNFSQNTRQVCLMVTDGLANCNWISGTYTGQYQGYPAGKSATEAARTYLLSTLGMNPTQDEFDSLAVLGGSEPPDITWLNNTIDWPQPGHIAPPFVKGFGWVSSVTTWQDFSARISQIFKLLFQSILLKAEIINAFTIDPNQLNNLFISAITPYK